MRKNIAIAVCVFLVSAATVPALSLSLNKNDLNWSIETVDYEGDVGRYTSLALDSNNYPHISYCDIGNGDLKYAYWDGSQWHTETVDTERMAGIPTAIALDSHGNPHIAYNEFFKKHLKYAYFDDNQWHVETVDSEGKAWGHLAIALDSNDYPHIAYADQENDDLKYAYFDGSQWHKEIVDSEGYISWFSVGAHAITIKDGYPHIFYGDNEKLKHAYFDGSQWNIEVIATGDGYVDYPSMRMDSKGYPHICFKDSAESDNGPHTLKYVYWDGSQWNKETVLSLPDKCVGGSCSLALDSHDYPHIAYYSSPAGDPAGSKDRDQEYIYWDGSAWNREVIDTDRHVGGCCDIAIDSNDNPVISYCYWEYFDLKCARKTTNNPPEKPEKPSGFKLGKVGKNYTYSTSASDADGEQLYYMFDWGDGSQEWLGPYASGETIKVKHSWDKEGNYTIRVKVKDTHYSESPWSDPLVISMPKTFTIWDLINMWLLNLLKALFH